MGSDERTPRSNWAALGRYPEHGGLSIDNNLAERMLRAQAIAGATGPSSGVTAAAGRRPSFTP